MITSVYDAAAGGCDMSGGRPGCDFGGVPGAGGSEPHRDGVERGKWYL